MREIFSSVLQFESITAHFEGTKATGYFSDRSVRAAGVSQDEKTEIQDGAVLAKL